MADDAPYELAGDLPLTISPHGSTPEARSLDALCQWLKERSEWVAQTLHEHGALRFRGFPIEGPEDFERLARAVDDDLKNEYLGTSPRDALTPFVFSASELPDFYPIPQHCEMSFCAVPPRAVFFACFVAPAEGSGETPLCDFRRVWRELEPGLRARFEERGLRIVRNYSGPESAGDPSDPMQLKRWDEMFLTSDRDEVSARCRAEGFEPSWSGGDGLRLVHSQPVSRAHPVTGETVWHNHSTTFHVGTALAEYRRIAQLRPSERHRGLVRIAEQLDARARARQSDEQPMHCTHLDGSEIDDADMEAVRDAVWRHMVIEPWRVGDVVAIDNYAVSHGRLPYEGERQIAVCWA